ncbi:transposase family protein [bacterium]|nr:transposase family protein [bacterium]
MAGKTSIDARILAECQQTLDTSMHGEKSPIIAKYAKLLHISAGQLRRHLREAFGTKRKPRADKGIAKVDRDAYDTIAKIILKAIDDDLMRRLSTSEAIRIAEEKGMITEGAISAGTFNRLAREDQALKNIRETVRWQADYPNQVWQVDTSGSEYLKVEAWDADLKDFLIAVRPAGEQRPYKNKPENEVKNRLWITGVVDDHSRLTFAEYFVAVGENAADVIDVLKKALVKKGDNLLQGRPEVIISDSGPFKHQLGESFCDSVGIELVSGKPKEHGYTSKVERFFNTYWRREIKRLLDPDLVVPLSEINRWLLNELQLINMMKHPILRQSNRIQIWQQINYRGGIAEVLPESLINTSFKKKIRTIRDNMTITVDRIEYKIPRPAAPGMKCRVMQSGDTGEVAVEILGTGQVLQAKLYTGPHPYGSFKGINKTNKEKLSKEAAEIEISQKLPSAELPKQEIPFVGKGSTVTPQKPFKETPGYYQSWDEAAEDVVQILNRPLNSLGDEELRGLQQMVEQGFSIRDFQEVVRKVKGALDMNDNNWKKVSE